MLKVLRRRSLVIWIERVWVQESELRALQVQDFQCRIGMLSIQNVRN